MAARLRLERIRIGSGTSFPVVLGESPPHSHRGSRVKRMVGRFRHGVSRYSRDLVAVLRSDTWRHRVRSQGPPLRKKVFQKLRRFGPQHTREHFRAVVERWMSQQVSD